MKERPILFSTEMVIAHLEKRKTMTRRMKGLEIINKEPNNWIWKNKAKKTVNRFWDSTKEFNPNPLKVYYTLTSLIYNKEVSIACPYGKPGDILWVRETLFQNGELGLEYFADKEQIDEEIIPEYYGPYIDYSFRKIPNIHMPKWAARIWLEITDIRVERLQNISEEDAIKEGAKDTLNSGNFEAMKHLKWVIKRPFLQHQFGFLALWCRINGPKSWDLNPWVWVVSYKIISTTGKPKHL